MWRKPIMNDEKIVVKIKRLMKIDQCSQRDLALYLGLSEVAISRYLNCNRKLTIDFVISISKLFKVSIDWLLNNEY